MTGIRIARLRRIAVVLAIVAAPLAVPSTAHAAVTPYLPACDNRGTTWLTTTNVVTPKTLTHYARYYNGTGLNMTTSFTATYQLQLSAGITVSAGGGVTASAVIASLQANSGIALSVAGSTTSTSSYGLQATLPPGKYLVAYSGYVKVTGNFTKYTCNSSGGLVTDATGTGRSYNTVREYGAQRCDLAAPSGSMAAVAKTTAC